MRQCYAAPPVMSPHVTLSGLENLQMSLESCEIGSCPLETLVKEGAVSGPLRLCRNDSDVGSFRSVYLCSCLFIFKKICAEALTCLLDTAC